MTELELLQSYWWLLISVLGAALVFMLFVQGGQSMLRCGLNESQRQLVVNALGRKWELTFTTLVVFGGAFFASFPLFYSTSFGGAYWLWMLILISFVLQAVSYEFRRKKGNLYGTATYDGFLMFNGLIGCVLLGVAVATFFFGGEFTITKGNILDSGSPVISQWSSTHGLEAIANIPCLILGFAVFFLARTQAAAYFINAVKDSPEFDKAMRKKVLINGIIFACLFIIFVLILLFSSGIRLDETGNFVKEDYLYSNNLVEMWWFAILFVVGVIMVLYAILRTSFSNKWRGGIWLTGIGSVLVVIVLFAIAGYNSTAYLPSVVDINSSLTISNSSSSLFTLKVMSVVSIITPFVIAYIAYVWRKMNATPITTEELNEESHKY